jgi:hypothetical protein
MAHSISTRFHVAPDTISNRGEQTTRANLSGFVKRLKDERARVEKQLSALNEALTAFVGTYGGSAKSRGTHKLSASARKKTSLAEKAR